MKVYFHSSFLLLSLLTIASCGSEGKTKASLEISHSFSALDFSGGLIIIASHSAGKKISIALDGSTSKTVELERGEWTFAAVGWDGASKFDGNQLCGSTIANLGSDSATVSLTVNAANCTTAFNTAVNFKSLMVTSCGIFKAYDNTSKDYVDLNGSPGDDTFCSNVPHDFKSVWSHYKIFSINSYNNSSSVGFDSGCLPMTPANRRTLPTNLFPFTIRTYKSNADCAAATFRSQHFVFKDGISGGDPNSFEHHFMPTDTAPQARLVLPSSFTRRGSSPFMSMVPRILCGTNDDCTPDLTTTPTSPNIYVSFSSENGGDKNRKLITTNSNLNSCPGSIFSGLTFFSQESCEVEDGNVFVEFVKNSFTCKDSSSPLSNMLDIVYKNNKVYMLFQNKISIYSDKGRFLKQLNISGTDSIRIAVNEVEEIFVIKANSVSKFTTDPIAVSGYTPEMINFILETAISGTSDFVDLEATGDFVYISNFDTVGPMRKIYSFSRMNGAPNSVSPTNMTSPTIEMNFHDNFLDVHLSQAGSTGIMRYPVSNGSIAAGSLLPYTPSVQTIASTYSDQHYYILKGTTYDVLDSDGNLVQNNNSVPTPLQAATKIVRVGNIAVLALPADLGSGRLTTTSLAWIQQTDTCNDTSIGWTLGTQSGSISIETQRGDASYNFYNNLIELFGRRKFTDPKALTYYGELAGRGGHDGEVRTGGKLGRVQQMLGPQGIGSFFWDYPDCASLKNSLPIGGSMTRSRTLSEVGSAETFDVIVEALRPYTDANSEISDGICDNTNSNATTCPVGFTHYDIQIKFSGTDSEGEKESTVMNLLCNSKLGRFESVETEDTKVSRTTFIYNTNLVSAHRYEEYRRTDEGTETSIELTLARKQGSEFWARTVNSKLQ